MNTIIISGRLTREPEIKHEDEKFKVCVFSVAVSRAYIRNGTRTVDFFECICYNKNADFCMKYLHKGQRVVIRGKMECYRHEHEGTKYSDWQLAIDEIDFADEKKPAEGEAQNEQKEERTPDEIAKEVLKKAAKNAKKAAEPQPEPEAAPVQESFMNIPEDLDDLPFA